MFSTLCTIKADTSEMAKNMKPRRNKFGVNYYEQSFDVALLFGLTELKAQICWKENVRIPIFSLNGCVKFAKEIVLKIVYRTRKRGNNKCTPFRSVINYKISGAQRRWCMTWMWWQWLVNHSS